MAWWRVVKAGCRGIGGGLLLIALAWPSVATVSAQPVEERADVRVIIDVSGSMRDNDPERLSASALELLVSLLPEGTLAGVWTFGERVDNPLPLSEVDAQWRTRARELRPELEGVQPFTDIEAAVRRAADAEANGARHLVLLTDGVIDLSPTRGDKPAVDEASRRALLEELAPRLTDQGTVVHAIAFSDQADMALVERLARSTGGLPALVESPESLLGAFLDIVERIFPADQIPLSEGRFAIEPGVEAFSALLFHAPDAEPLGLVAPDGSVYRAESPPPGGRWQVEPRFDLIRVPDPMPGEWRLEGEIEDDSRIGVTSTLSLHTGELPATLYLGFPVPVEAWLERNGSPYGEALEGLSVRVELLDADDEVQAALRLERDGERFRGELPAPALAGSARLRVRAEAEGLVRQRLQAVNVLPAIRGGHEPERQRVVLEAMHPDLDRDNAFPWGELDGERLEAEAIDERRWQIPLPELDDSVSRPLLLRARIRLDGEERELRLPRLLLFDEAATGLDLAGEGGRLSGDRFHEDLSTGRPGGEEPEGAVERFVTAVNDLVARGVTLWRSNWPETRRRLEAYAEDPRAWAVAGLVVFAVLVLLAALRRRRRHHRRIPHREEPHV